MAIGSRWLRPVDGSSAETSAQTAGLVLDVISIVEKEGIVESPVRLVVPQRVSHSALEAGREPSDRSTSQVNRRRGIRQGRRSPEVSRVRFHERAFSGQVSTVNRNTSGRTA